MTPLPTGWTALDSQVDGSSATGSTGTINFFEVSHPLNTGDLNDFSLSSGDIVGFCLTYFNDGTATNDSIYPPNSRLSDNEQHLYGDILIALPLGVIPEVPLGTATILLSMIIALTGFLGYKCFRPKFTSE